MRVHILPVLQEGSYCVNMMDCWRPPDTLHCDVSLDAARRSTKSCYHRQSSSDGLASLKTCKRTHNGESIELLENSFVFSKGFVCRSSDDAVLILNSFNDSSMFVSSEQAICQSLAAGCRNELT